MQRPPRAIAVGARYAQRRVFARKIAQDIPLALDQTRRRCECRTGATAPFAPAIRSATRPRRRRPTAPRATSYDSAARFRRSSQIERHAMSRSARARAVAPLRRELRAEEVATIRFETAPAQQLQIDFGETTRADRRRAGRRCICSWRRSATRGGPTWRCSSTSGSRRGCGHRGRLPPLRRRAARVAARQRQGAGELPRRADAGGSLQRALPRLLPLLGRAAAGVRAVPSTHQGQGRTRRGLRQAQRHRRPSLRLAGRHWKRTSRWWMREVADPRVHGTTGEPPIERFERRKRQHCDRLEGRTTFQPMRELRAPRAHRCLHRARHQPLQRAVAADRRERSACWLNDQVRIVYAGQEVAVHDAPGRRSGVRRFIARICSASSAASRGRSRAPSTRHRRHGPSCCGRCASTKRSPEGLVIAPQTADPDALDARC